MELKVRISVSVSGAARSHLGVGYQQVSERGQRGHSGACMRTAQLHPTVM